ncbi:MAG: hypothetical protein BECKG1743D_GA0114223_107772 [Candidatus Kentron sp. G]|nr:MAG: hypothetical protein BECKG1743F_GA0114225_107573 [Candidatus Kentron sp. G]VFN04671.1 MAG: hypothetical protein BECKG1743E_GA0114224_107592 [Candidatus Kentron sp. G]VFN05848.1 MAG: hypothetical protein BECKG1743D_GA0114223_107772 [Candidatus Kentron sp. G]
MSSLFLFISFVFAFCAHTAPTFLDGSARGQNGIFAKQIQSGSQESRSKPNLPTIPFKDLRTRESCSATNCEKVSQCIPSGFQPLEFMTPGCRPSLARILSARLAARS